MSVFSDIEKRHADYNHWINDETEPEWAINMHNDRAQLIAIIKAAKQELQDMRDAYAPDPHPFVERLYFIDEILEGKS